MNEVVEEEDREILEDGSNCHSEHQFQQKEEEREPSSKWNFSGGLLLPVYGRTLQEREGHLLSLIRVYTDLYLLTTFYLHFLLPLLLFFFCFFILYIHFHSFLSSLATFGFK